MPVMSSIIGLEKGRLTQPSGALRSAKIAPREVPSMPATILSTSSWVGRESPRLLGAPVDGVSVVDMRPELRWPGMRNRTCGAAVSARSDEQWIHVKQIQWVHDYKRNNVTCQLVDSTTRT